MSRWLARLGSLFALLGSAVALATAAMVVWSVTQRAISSRPIQGDVELVQFAIALAISLALPWCQLRRANIIVDFFTQRLGAGALRLLDALGCLFVALMCGLLGWRTAVGAMSVVQGGETTMVLSLPMWWTYAALAPGLALTALIAVHQASRLLRNRPVDDDAAQVSPSAAEGSRS